MKSLIEKIRITISICLLVLLTSCNRKVYQNSSNIDIYENEKHLYEFYKIDSVNNYYLVYLRNEKGKYKVVSKMAYRMFAEKIQVGGKYNLTITSIRPHKATIAGQEVMLPINVDCIYIDKITSVCIERRDSIFDIYRSENLAGLYLIK